MSEGEEQLKLKFKIFDGTDIGHRTYSSSTNIATLKQRILSEWPQDKSVAPKSVNDMKLIHAGKVLDNGKTLADSRVHVGDLPGGVITMHVVVQPPVGKRKTGNYPHRIKVTIQQHAKESAHSTFNLLHVILPVDILFFGCKYNLFYKMVQLRVVDGCNADKNNADKHNQMLCSCTIL